MYSTQNENIKDQSFIIESPDIIDAATLSIINNKWSSLIGDAGIGKTHYINTIVERFKNHSPSGIAGNNWRVVQTTLGLEPIKNLAEALSTPNVVLSSKYLKPDIQPQIEETLRENNQGLRKVYEMFSTQSSESFNILIILDDFEDIIRYQKLRKDRLDIDFISLFITAINDSTLPIYVLSSILPLYLYESIQYRGLSRIIEKGKITIPSISTDSILKKLNDSIQQDDSIYPKPILKYLLYQIKANEPLESLLFRINYLLRYFEGNKYQLEENDKAYLLKFGIDNNIQKRMSLLQSNQREAFIFLIKQIVRLNENNRLERNPISINQAVEILKEQFPSINNERVVLDIIRHFQNRELKLFHTINGSNFPVVDLYSDAFLYSWPTLWDWIGEEATSINIYKRLINEVFLYKNGEGEGELYQGQKLLAVINWVEDEKPTINWANRIETLQFSEEDKEGWAKKYHNPFDAVLDFIDKSKLQYDVIRDQENAIRQKKLQKANRRALFFSALFLLSLILLIVVVISRIKLKEEKEKDKMRGILENLKKAQLLVPESSDNYKTFDSIEAKIENNSIDKDKGLYNSLEEKDLFLMTYDPKDKNYLDALTFINKSYDIQIGKSSINDDKNIKQLKKLYQLNKNDQNPYVYIAMSEYYKLLLQKKRKGNTLSINHGISIYDIASNPALVDEFAFGDEEGNIVICNNLFDNLNLLKGEYAIRSIEYSDILTDRSNSNYQYIFGGSQSGQLLRWRWKIKNGTKIDSYETIRSNPYELLKLDKPIEQLQFFNSSNLGNTLAVGTSNRILFIDIEKSNRILNQIKSKETIVSWSITPEGNYIFYSTPSQSYIQKIDSKYSNKKITLEHPRSLIITASAINDAIEGNQQIILGTNNGLILQGDLLRFLKAHKKTTRKVLLDELVEDDIENAIPRFNAAVSKIVYNPFHQSYQLASASIDGTIRIIDTLPQPEKNDIRLIENNRDIWTLDFKNRFEIIAGENRSMEIWISNVDSLYSEIIRLDSL